MRPIGLLMVGFVFAWTGCDSDGPDKFNLNDGKSGDASGEYLDEESEVVVIHGDDGSYVFEDDEFDEGTLEVDGKDVDINEEMEDDPVCKQENAQIDLIVVEGEIVDIICYLPPEDVGEDDNYTEVTGDGDMSIPQNDNNKVIIFDESTDGEWIEGDLTLDSNNGAIYGNGRDNTIIDGNVTLDGNNPILRAVTITGDLTIVKNNAAVLFCRVLGNVYVVQNNVTIAETEIFGNLDFDTNSSNNAVLVNNYIAGDWNINGSGHICSGNKLFVDDDVNEKVSDEELGDPLICTGP